MDGYAGGDSYDLECMVSASCMKLRAEVESG